MNVDQIVDRSCSSSECDICSPGSSNQVMLYVDPTSADSTETTETTETVQLSDEEGDCAFLQDLLDLLDELDFSDDVCMHDLPSLHTASFATEERHFHDAQIPDSAIDHIIVGVANLDESLSHFCNVCGVPQAQHSMIHYDGLGIKSVRFSLGEFCFLEIIGPDERQPDYPLHKDLSTIKPGEFTPFHFAIRKNAAFRDGGEVFHDWGFDKDSITMYSKDKKCTHSWQLTLLRSKFLDTELGGAVPMLVQCSEDFHISQSLPVIGRLEKVDVTFPRGHPAHALLDSVAGVNIFEGEEPTLRFVFISNSHMRQSFQAQNPRGLSFPFCSPMD